MKKFQKTINGEVYKGEYFEEKDLINKFKKSKNDWELVDSYQKTFQALLLEDVEGFVIDARTLWNELGKPYDEFAKFMKKKVFDLFENNVDYEVIDLLVDKSKRSKNGRPEVNYNLTLETAKSLALGVGTTKKSSKEVRDKGNLVRRYFILMENIIKKNEYWNEIREPEKEGAKIMKSAICNWCIRNGFDNLNEVFYTREFNMLNLSLTGMDAQQLRLITNTKDKQTRDNLTAEVNKALSFLQFTNTALLNNNLDFKTRTEFIKVTCENTYKNIKNMIG